MQIPKRGLIINKLLLGIIAFGSSFSLLANPVLDHIGSGSVNIDQSNPTSTIINQSGPKAIINWQSFNIGASESTHFQQPAGGIALNRINPMNGVSQIFGRLTATGQIILVNPAGIFFGPTSFVNVGGLIASTANISNEDFLSGQFRFTQVPGFTGTITNQGQLIAAEHGLIALVGNRVENNGLIEANLGQVALASGNSFTMSFAGNDLISFAVDAPAASAYVHNNGVLRADGGKILVTAKGAANVLDNVINMEGIAQAKSIYQKNGEIIISGDPNGGVVRVASKVKASGKGTGHKGGKVTVTGYNILLDADSLIDVSGDIGGGTVLVGGNYKGKGPLPHANAIYMAPTTEINADAIESGHGGEVVLWSDQATKAYGKIFARGGANSGDGGLIETSSKAYLDVNGITINTLAAHGKRGTWLLDPADLTISIGGDNNVTGASPFEPAAPFTASNLNVGTLVAALGGGDVVVQTGNDAAAGDGDITVNDSISWPDNTNLTLSAYQDLIINNNIIPTGTGSLTIISNTGSVGGITQINAGTVIVSATGLLSGNYELNPGAELRLANANALNATTLVVNGGFLSRTGTGSFATPTTNPIILNANLNINIPADLFLTGNISGSGGITKSGLGLLTFGAANNNYSGATIINNGNVSSNSPGGLSPNSAFVINNAASFLTLSGVGGAIGSLAGVGTIELDAGGGLTSGANNTSTTFNGTIIGVNGTFGKTGTGVLTLGATNADSDTTYVVNQGTLRLGVFNAIPVDSPVQISFNGTLDLNNFNAAFSNLNANLNAVDGIIQLGTGSLTLVAGGPSPMFFLDGAIEGSGKLIIAGADVALIHGFHTYTFTGGTDLNSGTLALGDNTEIGTGLFTLNGGTLDAGGTIANAYNINDTGIPINILSSTLFTGLGAVNGNAIVDIADSVTFNNLNGPGGITFQGAGSVEIAGNLGGTTPLSDVTANLAAFNANNATINTTGFQQYNSPVNIAAGTSTFTSQGSTLQFASTLNGPGALTLNDPTNTVSFLAAVGGVTPLASLTITAANTSLSGGSIQTVGDQIYNGIVTLLNPATLNITGAGTANININNGITGNLDLILSNTNGNANFNLLGTLTLNNFTVNGNPTGNNTLFLDTGSDQTWQITGTNSGNLIALSNVGGTAIFNNIQNLTGGTIIDLFDFVAGSISGVINGGGNYDTVQYSAYPDPVSVIMTNPTTGSGNAYNTDVVVNGTINPANLITQFTNMGRAIGNSQGFFLVPPGKENQIVFNVPVQFGVPFVASGSVIDPIDFEQFLFFFNANVVPPVALNVNNNAVFQATNANIPLSSTQFYYNDADLVVALLPLLEYEYLEDLKILLNCG